MFLALLPIASAEVVRVEIAQRVTIGASGYEKISGTLHFAVDPADPRNAIVADQSWSRFRIAALAPGCGFSTAAAAPIPRRKRTWEMDSFSDTASR